MIHKIQRLYSHSFYCMNISSKSIKIETESLKLLKQIKDPIIKSKDIVALGRVKNISQKDTNINFDVVFPTKAYPNQNELIESIKTKLNPISEQYKITINPSIKYSQPFYHGNTTKIPGLANVRHIIGVSSCKGGVGKSTVSVNLAYSLAKLGGRVGLLDADIYGPSLPSMINPTNTKIKFNGEFYYPLEYEGVKNMSFGFLSNSEEAASIRGPIISGYLMKLLGYTKWGDLDYLVIDLPPGTGDVQITLCQQTSLSGSVIVTTPHKLSLIDVRKGINLFAKLKVPSLCIVENMAYFKPKDEIYYPFGKGNTEKLLDEYGIKELYKFPLDSTLSESCNDSIPYILKYPQNEITQKYLSVAKHIVKQLIINDTHPIIHPNLMYNPKTGLHLRIVSQESAKDYVLNCKNLRLSCKCAECIDEMTNEIKIKKDEISDKIYPVGISTKGNYAVHIEWSDNHKSIYTFAFLEKLAQSSSTQTN